MAKDYDILLRVLEEECPAPARVVGPDVTRPKRHHPHPHLHSLPQAGLGVDSMGFLESFLAAFSVNLTAVTWHQWVSGGFVCESVRPWVCCVCVFVCLVCLSLCLLVPLSLKLLISVVCCVNVCLSGSSALVCITSSSFLTVPFLLSVTLLTPFHFFRSSSFLTFSYLLTLLPFTLHSLPFLHY